MTPESSSDPSEHMQVPGLAEVVAATCKVLTVVAACLVAGTCVYVLVGPENLYRLNPNPAQVDLPWIEAELDSMPNVHIEEVIDGGIDENHEIRIILRIQGKGNLTLYNATRQSFTGKGPIFIRMDWGCNRATIENIGRGGPYPALQFDTVAEAINHYDAIQAELAPMLRQMCKQD